MPPKKVLYRYDFVLNFLLILFSKIFSGKTRYLHFTDDYFYTPRMSPQQLAQANAR